VDEEGTALKSPFHDLMNKYSSKDSQALLKSFASVDDEPVRDAVVDFVQAMASLKRR